MSTSQFTTFRSGGTVYCPTYGAPTKQTTVPIPGAGQWVVVLQYL
ncbi:MAG: hypothetical protein ACYDAR_12205 [Thermomicrobiales bacterium]